MRCHCLNLHRRSHRTNNIHKMETDMSIQWERGEPCENDKVPADMPNTPWALHHTFIWQHYHVSKSNNASSDKTLINHACRNMAVDPKLVASPGYLQSNGKCKSTDAYRVWNCREEKWRCTHVMPQGSGTTITSRLITAVPFWAEL